MIKGLKSFLPKASLVFMFMFVFVMFMPFLNNTAKVLTGTGIANSVEAESVLCTIFPFLNGIAFAANLCDPSAAGSAGSVVGLGLSIGQLGLSLVFVGIIAVAVYTIIRAALKYIRAEGDDSKVEEAQKSIKRVFIGIGALLVGIIGLAIIIGVFGASGGLDQGNIDPNKLTGCFDTNGEIIPGCLDQK